MPKSERLIIPSAQEADNRLRRRVRVDIDGEGDRPGHAEHS